LRILVLLNHEYSIFWGILIAIIKKRCRIVWNWAFSHEHIYPLQGSHVTSHSGTYVLQWKFMEKPTKPTQHTHSPLDVIDSITTQHHKAKIMYYYEVWNKEYQDYTNVRIKRALFYPFSDSLSKQISYIKLGHTSFIKTRDPERLVTLQVGYRLYISGIHTILTYTMLNMKIESCLRLVLMTTKKAQKSDKS